LERVGYGPSRVAQRNASPLHLATAVHIVEPASNVFVRAFTAIELIPMRVSERLFHSVKIIVAIPAIEDILALASPQHPVVALAPVDDVIARLAGQEISAWPAMENVLAPVVGEL
jgi:hypothetical protein